ncbi:hypothetical protein RUND412_003785 [Rhizina undulata]
MDPTQDPGYFVNGIRKPRTMMPPHIPTIHAESSSTAANRKRPRQEPKPRRLSSDERKGHYDRIEKLTVTLSFEVNEEMARRKESWDIEGDREEEQKWELRKQEVYKGLEELAQDIERAIRDRKKEAVLELWDREMEEKRLWRLAESTRKRNN